MSRNVPRASLRFYRLSTVGLIFLLAAAAPISASPTGLDALRNALASTPAPASEPPAPEPLAPETVEAEVAHLRAAFAAEVPRATHRTPASDHAWIARAQAELADSPVAVNRPQLIVVVDRSPVHQEICIVMARPDGAWEVIGGTRVSTGQPGRFDHYVTPTGVFQHTDAILDYRAEGTFNENHIRGLGVKGMRVWDFGWHPAVKGWGAVRDTTPIRFEMHATDPAILEQRIGSRASQGCVRIPDAMNRFMDLHGVLDADYEVAAVTDIRYRALLRRDRTPSKLAGDTLVVVDSSEPLPR
jgi:hypothetical protein